MNGQVAADCKLFLFLVKDKSCSTSLLTTKNTCRWMMLLPMKLPLVITSDSIFPTCPNDMNQIRFLKTQFKEIQIAARNAAKLNGREVCGLILDNGYFLELVQVRNKTQRGGGFSYYYNEIRAIEKMARTFKHRVVGGFHSHPVGLPVPGPSDVKYALDDDVMLIFDVLGRTAKLWRIKKEKARELQFSLI
jgi:proteasome lid subunit RPN8/RPN11